MVDGLRPGGLRLCRVELSLIWFGLFRWRRRGLDVPAHAIPFPATRTGVEVALCWLTLSGPVIETPPFVLLGHVWGGAAAWA